MKYRKQDQGGDLFAFIDHQRKTARQKVGISKLSELIDWNAFRGELEEILSYKDREASRGGRPPFDPVFMFKVLVLQKYYQLSDAAAEQQIADRFSFLAFLGLRPGDDIPDGNTIWDFREALERDGRNGTKRLFKRFEELLEERHLIGREGSLVDATFVDVPRQRNTREENKALKEDTRPEGFEAHTAKGRQKDGDARWAKKNNETHYGYKNHVKADAKSKLVTEYETSSANVHDSQVFKPLVNKTDQAVFADSAYLSEENLQYVLEDCDSEEFIMLKAQRAHPLSPSDQKTNKLRSRVRVRVEHIFGRMSQFGMDKIRTIGALRAHQQNGLSNLVYNMDRYAFLCR